jgi:uncharacterized protein
MLEEPGIREGFDMNLASSIGDIWINRRVHVTPDVAAARLAVAHLQPAVVVTGGSRGIGLAIAERFAADGAGVCLVARDDVRLQAAADRLRAQKSRSTVATIALDVTVPDAPASLEAALAAQGFYCDVLVNNAGAGSSGVFDQAPPAAIERLMALNIVALTRLSRHALAACVSRRRGGLINISSLGGAVPGPNQAAYYASKAYVTSLTEALAVETSGLGVRLSAVLAGPVETGFHAEMGADAEPYRTFLPQSSPERVAAAAVTGFHLGQRVIVPGVLNKVMYLALKILPHRFSAAFVGVLLGLWRGRRG